MSTRPPLAFRVNCRACFGTEVWRRERIVRTLTAAGVLAAATVADDERLAQLFIANSEKLTCVGCGKAEVLIVQRI